MRVNLEELETQPDQSYWLHGHPFTGTVVYRREDGSIESEVEFLDGVQEGEFRDFDSAGSVILKGTIQNGVYHGELGTFDSTGAVQKMEVFEYGIRKSFKEWAGNGELIRDEVISANGSKMELLEKFRRSHRPRA